MFPSYLEAIQPCRLQSTPLYSVCTAASVSSIFWSIPGKIFKNATQMRYRICLDCLKRLKTAAFQRWFELWKQTKSQLVRDLESTEAVEGESSRVWPRSHVNSILFLIIRQQAWHKCGCNAMHAQIFSKNFMAQCFWDPHFLSYLLNCQTTIWTDDFTNFATLSSVFDVDGRPERGSASTEVRPSLKRFHHSYVWVLPMAFSLNAIFNI